MVLRRAFKKEYRSRAVEWAIIYTLHLFVAIGLIVASGISMRYGDGFSNSSGANTGTANGAGAAAPADAGDGEGGEAEAAAATTPEAQQQLLRKQNALIHSGVMSSIGLASGIVALVLNLTSFIVQNWLNSLWDSRPKERVYGSKLYAGLLVISVNIILFGGNIALCWGFSQASADARHWVIGNGAATGAYLRASAVLAGLLAFMALATAVADYLSLRSAEKELDARTDPQKRALAVETAHARTD